MDDNKYPGKELELFDLAENWKSYWIGLIRPFIGKKLLEVGAGIGANTVRLSTIDGLDVMCLEPDSNLAAQLKCKLNDLGLDHKVKASVGYVKNLDAKNAFDTILYSDVLEHIKSEKQELSDAVDLLQPHGHLIILSPAHQFLYSNFDKAIGHCRRYSRQSLQDVIPQGLKAVRLQYLDSVGLFASMANRLILKQDNPSLKQILAWDRWFVPLSCRLDSILRFKVGKSILGVWQKL